MSVRRITGIVLLLGGFTYALITSSDRLSELISFTGMVLMLGFAWLISTDRKRTKLDLVLWGTAFQLLFGIFILRTSAGHAVFEGAKHAFVVLLGFTKEGTRFVFGSLLDEKASGWIFAIQVLPTIIFFSAITSILYYLGILQRIVYFMGRAMQKTMGTSGAESLAAAANVFIGQTEAPLVVKPYLDRMTTSELMALMTGGMATVAGGVLAAYVEMGIDAGHLLSASVMSAPAALVMAKLMIPETEVPMTKDEIKMTRSTDEANVIDAACRGAGSGLNLALNVGAMLLAFIALIAMSNYLLGMVTDLVNWIGGLMGIDYYIANPLTLEQLLGWFFAPLAWVMGVPWADCGAVGTLLGEKIVLTEFIAYVDLGKMAPELSHRATVISTYALCGFANFASIAIQIGGIGTLVPRRKSELAKLGLKAVIGGSLAAFMTATVAGILI